MGLYVARDLEGRGACNATKRIGPWVAGWQLHVAVATAVDSDYQMNMTLPTDQSIRSELDYVGDHVTYPGRSFFSASKV